MDCSRAHLSFDARAFRLSAPKIWNFLPLHIHQHTLPSDVILKRTTFTMPLAALIMCPDSLLRVWRYINLIFTYTYFKNPKCIKTLVGPPGPGLRPALYWGSFQSYPKLPQAPTLLQLLVGAYRPYPRTHPGSALRARALLAPAVLISFRRQ